MPTKEPDSTGPRAREIHAHAQQFLRDALALGESGTPGQFVLFSHAIALALKSFLHNKGESLKALRLQFGHDLVGLLRKAREYGLPIADLNAETVLRHLNEHGEQVVKRCNFGHKPMSGLADFVRVANAIVHATKAAER